MFKGAIRAILPVIPILCASPLAFAFAQMFALILWQPAWLPDAT
jgi:hypothetical protein